MSREVRMVPPVGSTPERPAFATPEELARICLLVMEANRMRPRAVTDQKQTGVAGWMSPTHHLLLNERQHLLDKKFAGTITAAQEYRLEVVRGALDAIDAAREDALRND